MPKRNLLYSLKHYLLASALFLSGCVFLPNKEPFPEQSLAKLSSGDANKRLVLGLFGKPSAVKNRGEYWFYGRAREVVGILAGGAVIEDYEWLAVKFDDSGKIEFYEFNDSNYGCLSNGICNLGGLIFGKSPGVVITAPYQDDHYAKSYYVGDDECAVYLYQEPIFHIRAGNYPVSLTVGDNSIGTINYETYLFFTHPPGEISLKAYQFDIKTNCDAGDKVYIKAEEGWSVDEGKDLAPVSSTVGGQEIQKRRLALPD